MKLSEVNKVQNMLISIWTNAVMFRVNAQNVLCQLQRRLSVACAIHWSRCQSLPGPDGLIPPRHDGAALPCPWSGGGSTHTVVGSPTRIVDGIQIRLFGGNIAYHIRTASGAWPTATRTTFDAASSINLTQCSFNSTQHPSSLPRDLAGWNTLDLVLNSSRPSA